jgi:hypothetical protein
MNGTFTRRGFFYASGGVGSALLFRLPLSAPAPRDDMVLRVARTVAVFPVTFPFVPRAGGAATQARLSEAAASFPPDRLALARAGADRLIASGLRQLGPARLLEGRAEQAESTAACVALAIATLSERLRPHADLVAQAWLDGLRGILEAR